MRLFVALWPPPEAIAELAAEVARVRPAGAGLRWSDADHWHLTLAFLGEVTDDQRVQLEQRLARAAARHEPLILHLAGAGRFGARVLFTRVQGDRDSLRRLAGSAAAAARRSGLDLPNRPYRPHLTLARSRTEADLRPAVEALEGFLGTEWTAGVLHLVHSQLGAGPGRGSSYRTIASWSLGRTL